MAQSRSWSLLDLLEYKLYRSVVFNKSDNGCQYDETLFRDFTKATQAVTTWLIDVEKAHKRLGDPNKLAEGHELVDRIVRSLKQGRDYLIIGASSSGKTVLSLQVGIKLSSEFKVKYIDVGTMPISASAQWLSVFRQSYPPASKKGMLIYDDLQANPSVATYLLKIAALFNDTSVTSRVTSLALTWLSYSNRASTLLPRADKQDITSRQAIQILKYKYKPRSQDIPNIESLAKNDVLLWRLLLEEDGRDISSEFGLAHSIWKKRAAKYRKDASAMKRALLIASLLGQYEFEVTQKFLEKQADVDDRIIRQLIGARLLRDDTGRLSAGHQSQCALSRPRVGEHARLDPQLARESDHVKRLPRA